MIGILNYGAGNLQSVYNAFEYLGEMVFLINTPNDFKKAEGIIIPGVGHFKKGISSIIENGFLEPLNLYVREKKIPCLGICLGMQLMADIGFEGGENKGLEWMPAIVEKIDYEIQGFALRIPHVGWNEVTITKSDSPLFKDMRNPTFYFVHSYFVNFKEKEDYITSYVNYGRKITASFEKDNIFAVQFHPEKSQQDGIKLLKNYLEIVRNG